LHDRADLEDPSASTAAFASYSREQSLTQLDDFPKWLSAAAAVVGTLGASFGVSGANPL